MARVGKLRLLYRVAFFCFCVIFACSYPGGTSGYDRGKYITRFGNLKEELKSKSFKTKDDTRLKREEYAPGVTENLKNVDVKKQQKNSRITRKGNFRQRL